MDAAEEYDEGGYRSYRVSWVIDVDADSPRDAAWKARRAATRPGSIATVYSVEDRTTGETTEIDLTRFSE